MKKYLILAVIVSPLLASCAHPLETVVNEQRQQRLESAYTNKPINNGAGDGLGAYIAESGNGLTLLSSSPK